jgi:hypothetical protein
MGTKMCKMAFERLPNRNTLAKCPRCKTPMNECRVNASLHHYCSECGHLYEQPGRKHR